MVELVHVTLRHPLALLNQLVEEEEVTKAITTNNSGEAEVGEAGCKGEEELDHHIVGATSGDA